MKMSKGHKVDIRCAACKQWVDREKISFIEDYPICSYCKAEYDPSGQLKINKKLREKISSPV